MKSSCKLFMHNEGGLRPTAVVVVGLVCFFCLCFFQLHEVDNPIKGAKYMFFQKII